MQYIFFLGNAPELSQAEIESVLKNRDLKFTAIHNPKVSLIETDSPLDENFFNMLGGTVKVGEVFSSDKSDESLAQKISDELLKVLKKDNINKISFGLNSYEQRPRYLGGLAKEIKLALSGDFKIRFVLPHSPETELSSVVIRKQSLADFSIVEINAATYLARTVWVQDFEDWGKRDYGRPEVQAHIGMLPPKVARMMINLSLPKSGQESTTILDPFCGVGTVLAEGLVIGLKIVGSDSDIGQVRRTKANLAWLSEAYDLHNTKYQIHQSDARNLKDFLKEKVDAIVTEPDLGPNNPNIQLSRDVSIKLENLYLSCLQSWKEVLKMGGRVVIVLPGFAGSKNISNHNDNDLVKTVVDKAKIMGYSVTSNPIQYARPQAKVIRNICVFELN